MLIHGLEKEKVIRQYIDLTENDKGQHLGKWMCFFFSLTGRHSHLVINLGKEASTPKLQ